MGSVAFDPSSHTYKLSGREIPACTRCLDVAGLADFSMIRADVLEAKSELGTQVHTAAHYYDDGGLDWSSVPEISKPYVNAWADFVSTQCFMIDPTQIEKESVGVINGMFYGMKPDRVGLMRGRPAIVDLKIGAPMDHHAIQLAGYAAGLPHAGDPPEIGWLVRFMKWERYRVQLLPSGKFKLTQFRDPQDVHVFSWALGITTWKLAKGNKIRGLDDGE